MELSSLENNMNTINELSTELAEVVNKDNGWQDDVCDSYKRYVKEVEENATEIAAIFHEVQMIDENNEAFERCIHLCKELIVEANSL